MPHPAIEQNRVIHDRIAREYDSLHAEIFNEIEQARLAASVREAVALVQSTAGVRALDVGAGTGNLARHLCAAKARVTAADVSAQSLGQLREKLPEVETSVLDGEGLSQFADASFDFVGCYSVLHHVPDYLALVREMARVTKPGGVVYLDHERTDESWDSAEYAAFLSEANPQPPKSWWRFLKPVTYWRRLKRALWPRWMPEGDLHIWPDDHIQWKLIEPALAESNVNSAVVHDYLLFDSRYRRDVWECARLSLTDYRTFIGRKQ